MVSICLFVLVYIRCGYDYVRTGSEDHRTCVNTYYFFNDDKMAQITLSYRQADASKWKEDFENVIRTFKWLK